MATKKETYTEAMKRLEAIVSQIESNELDIDELKKTPNELDIVNINRTFAFVLPQRTQSHTEEYFYV